MASWSIMVATGINADCNREVVSLMLGDGESEAFWQEFLRSLHGRGLSRVRLVVTKQPCGLVVVVRKVLLGAAWKQCRVQFLRNVFGVIDRDCGER
ncbi:transposase [Streptomyces melanogenes]|uniref:transposase n=1 Tax=Streptomyces melanogenes TaxID=67326 RepID=UPI0037A32827